MNKTIIGIVILGIIGLGWFLMQDNTITYVATITDEVAQLETELAAITDSVVAGTMNPEDAKKAQIAIYARLNAVDTAIAKSKDITLTEAQQVTLMSGLARLRTTLAQYQTTLSAIDDAVSTLPEAERPKRSSGGRSSNNNETYQTLTESISETIGTVEEYAEEAVDDYVPPDEIEDTDVTDADADSIGDEGSDDTVSDVSSDMSDDTTTQDTESMEEPTVNDQGAANDETTTESDEIN